MKMKIEITTKVDIGEIRYQLLSNLTPKQLTNFIMDMIADHSDVTEFVRLLKKELDKIKIIEI